LSDISYVFYYRREEPVQTLMLYRTVRVRWRAQRNLNMRVHA